MVVDTSALIAITLREPGWEQLLAVVRAVRPAYLSAATFVEFRIVAQGRLGAAGIVLVERLLRDYGVEIVPLDETQARLAAEAYARYGKGFHPAGLNFGDCFSYALAKQLNQPLLYKGDDFSRTDIPSALTA